MSWKQRQLTDSIGGEPFHLLTENEAGGQRGPDHEYPQQDKSWPEQMGAKIPRFLVVGVLVGDDYDLARDRMRAVLTAPGPHRFTSRFGDDFLVVVRDWNISQDALRQGKCDLSLSLVRYEQASTPLGNIDPDAVLTQATSDSQAALQASFQVEFSVSGLADHFVDDALAIAARGLALIDDLASGRLSTEDLAADVALGLDDLDAAGLQALLDPGDFASQVLSLTGAVGRSLSDSRAAPGQDLAELSDFDPDPASIPLLTDQRRQQRANRAALGSLFRGAALISEAEGLIGRDFAVYEDAQAAMTTLISRIEREMQAIGGGEAWDDGLFGALQDLRRAVWHAMTARGADLARLIALDQATPVPVQLLAYQLYDDVSRGEEIAKRNGLPHPGIALGSLTVLDQ